jgi:hypothetical protein
MAMPSLRRATEAARRKGTGRQATVRAFGVLGG